MPQRHSWVNLASKFLLTNSKRSLYSVLMIATESNPAMTCPACERRCQSFGKHRNGLRRYRCADCRKTYTQEHARPLGGMTVPMEKAVACLQLMVEGCSIRTIERITGIHRDTILRLLVLAGERCERLLAEKVRNVPVADVQVDEIWGYVGCKERNVPKDGEGRKAALVGDAWCFAAIERNSKLILAWHLGRRTAQDTDIFMEKLDSAAGGHFQLTTDAFKPYKEAVALWFGVRADYATLVKTYARPNDNEVRYSPAKFAGSRPVPQFGNPERARISTSHVERQNLTMRMMIRRLTRLTNAFSKKWENLHAALALHFAYYNFCRVHSSLRVTPAMQAGITGSVWTLQDLLA